MKKKIAIYPGRFQPMGPHHAETFNTVMSKYGVENSYIVTSNKVDFSLKGGVPKSPLNFQEKKSIMIAHGIPEDKIIQVLNPYYVKEILFDYKPEEVEVIYLVGAKDMAENPRFKKTGGVTKEGYKWRIEVVPHVEKNIGGEEMSGTSTRVALKDGDEKTFKDIMGWFDQDIYDNLKKKLNNKDIRNALEEAFGLKESLKVDKDGNLIGIPNPPDTNKIKNSISKITNWCEMMVDAYPSEDPNGRGWEILPLSINDISDVVVMHGNDVFKLPESKYRNESSTMDIRITPDDGEVAILLWTKNQSLDILHPELIGNTYGKGIISLKYKGKLIGDDFSRDINYGYGEDDYVIENDLNEGRYDTISNEISSDIFKYWKTNAEDGEITFEGTYQHESQDIHVEATLTISPEIEIFDADGGTDDQTNFIVAKIGVNPNELPRYWSKISMTLKDIIRHEIEHLTHGDSSHLKYSKYMKNDELIRKAIKTGLLSKHRYFELEKEIDANLQGMYFRAKKEKRPFKDVIDDYLTTQNLTPEQKEGILTLWRERNKALNLPLFENEELMNETVEGKTLYAFDLDDTLITSNSKVIINNPNKDPQILTPAEYAIYEPQLGDEPDFREFAGLKDPKVIPEMFNLFSQILTKTSGKSNAKTIILTARQPEVISDVKKFLASKGLADLKVHAVGSSDPMKKVEVILDYIEDGYKIIEFYDDSPKNVRAVKTLDKTTDASVKSKLVKSLHEMLFEFSGGAIMNKQETGRHKKKLAKLRKHMEKQGSHMVPYPDLPKTVIGGIKLFEGLTDKQRKYWTFHYDLFRNLIEAAIESKKLGIDPMIGINKAYVSLSNTLGLLKYKKDTIEALEYFMGWFRDGGVEKIDEMYPPYKANMVQKTRYKASDTWTNDPNITESVSNFRELYSASPPELQQIVMDQKKAQQNPEWHPEGNVLKHIITVTNRAIKDYPDNMDIILAAYFHDLGKLATSGVNPKTGHPTAHGHEKVSAGLTRKYSEFISKMGASPENVEYLVSSHMKIKPRTWDVMRQSKKDKMQQHPSFDDLGSFTKIDRGGLDLEETKLFSKDWWKEIIQENILQEGGNVFKNQNKKTTTIRIDREDVDPTLKWLEDIVGLDLINNKLGSTGIRSTSGDLDIAVNQEEISKDEVLSKLANWVQQNHPEDDVKQWTRKIGINVHFKTPIRGDETESIEVTEEMWNDMDGQTRIKALKTVSQNSDEIRDLFKENWESLPNEFKNNMKTVGYVQTDLMFGNPEWMKFALKGTGDDTVYKGVHRLLLMASIAKSMGMKYSTASGLVDRESNEVISNSPEEIATQLLGKGAKSSDLDSVESIHAKIKGHPNYEAMVADAKANFNFKEIPPEKNILQEGARIDHAEDIVFWEGSKGALRAVDALRNLEKGGHKEVTIKWDGSPAITFGRDENGDFILTDKNGYGAKGYDGKTKSADDLEKMLLSRGKEVTDSRRQFAGSMKSIFDEYERAVPQDYRGIFDGDLLYYTTPPVKDKNYIFKPNIVQYAVDVDSELGKKIGKSKTGVVIHNQRDSEGNKIPLKDTNIFQGDEALVVPPITAEKAPDVPNEELNRLEDIIKKDANDIDTLLNQDTLRKLQLTNLSDILYRYVNSKVDTGLEDLGKDFINWLPQSKQSQIKQKRVIEYISQNQKAFDSLWEVVGGIMSAKDHIIDQLDKQGSNVKQSIGGQEGGEGYVLAHPGGNIKLVPRATFSKANRAVQRT